MLKFGVMLAAAISLSGCYVGGAGNDGSKWVAYIDDDSQDITAVSSTGLLCKGIKDSIHDDQWMSSNKVDMRRLFLSCSTRSEDGVLGPITHIVIGGFEEKANIPEYADKIDADDPTVYYQLKWTVYDKNMQEEPYGETISGPLYEMRETERTGDFSKASEGTDFEEVLKGVFDGELYNHGKK